MWLFFTWENPEKKVTHLGGQRKEQKEEKYCQVGDEDNTGACKEGGSTRLKRCELKLF